VFVDRERHRAVARQAGVRLIIPCKREKYRVKSRAAVLHGVGEEWKLEEITLDPPHAGEVLVRMKVAGLCHSDDHFATGDGVPGPEIAAMLQAAGINMPEWFPLLGGHEGAGVVEEVGPGVTALAPGDHVVTSFMPACGKCRWCVSGISYLCDLGANVMSREMITDGTPRRHLDGQPLLAFTQLGTFSEYLVAAEASVVKIDPEIPFHAGSLVSCGVGTGWGSATVRAGTQPGDTVVVIGVGGVGMNAVQGARAAGAQHVVAVDPVESKRDIAPSFGATHTSPDVQSALELVGSLTLGVMADRVIVTTGVLHVELVPAALMLTRKGGTCVLTALPRADDTTVPLVLTDLINSSKELRGALYGGMNPRTAVPMLLSMYKAGRVKLDELVTQRYRLDDINQAVADMRSGANIRGVIVFDD
jgi:NDMA-dependent alcohol dehydrogenase